MRRWLIILFFVMFLPSIYAQSCLDEDTIMRLSATANAHGQKWDYTGAAYPIEICYSHIFGVGYNPSITGTSMHGCSSGPIIRLSGDTNAHAERPDMVNPRYGESICYGDLVCRTTNAQNDNCNANEREVISISADTNAHIENSTVNNYLSNTNYKICCSSAWAQGSGVQTLESHWRYYDGTIINNGALVCPNSHIIMSTIALGYPDGTPITFQIYDDDVGIDDPIGPPLSANIYSNHAFIILDLTNPTILGFLNSEFGGGEGNELELLFDASTSSQSDRSEIANYRNDENACSYPNPTASITAPVHRGIYFTNTIVNFTASCISRMGPMAHSWEVTQAGQVYTSNEPNFTLRFGTDFGGPGQALVRLRCTDLGGRYAVDEAQMLAVASPYTFAYINDPGYDSFVYNSPAASPYFPNKVPFSASDSYVVDADGCTVSCLGGYCPIDTENSPLSCGGGRLTVSSPAEMDYSSLSFDWRFWDNNWNEPWSSYEGSGIYQGTVFYDDVSSQLNDKHMSLTITHSSGASASFQRDFTLGLCLNNGNTFYRSSSEALPTTTQENNACAGGDSTAGTADDCCPAAHECMDIDGDNSYKCEIPTNIVTRCEDYTSEDSCNGNTNPAIPQASYGQAAATCTFLRCQWISATNTCGVRAIQYPQDPQTGCGINPINDCAWTTTQTECVNGRKTISYTGAATNLPTCSRDPVTVPCGSLNFELSFFGKIQLVIALIVIAIIYIALKKRRRHKADGKRNK